MGMEKLATNIEPHNFSTWDFYAVTDYGVKGINAMGQPIFNKKFKNEDFAGYAQYLQPGGLTTNTSNLLIIHSYDGDIEPLSTMIKWYDLDKVSDAAGYEPSPITYDLACDISSVLGIDKPWRKPTTEPSNDWAEWHYGILSTTDPGIGNARYDVFSFVTKNVVVDNR